jgi:hypothetical protein
MSFAIFSIILSIISLFLSLLFSANVAEWFVWAVYSLVSVFFFVQSFIEYNLMLKGEPKSTGSIMGIAAYPFVTLIMGAFLIALLFVDINKLHLLWVYPVIAIIFEFTIGKKAWRKIQSDGLRKIEKDK